MIILNDKNTKILNVIKITNNKTFRFDNLHFTFLFENLSFLLILLFLTYIEWNNLEV